MRTKSDFSEMEVFAYLQIPGDDTLNPGAMRLHLLNF